MKNKGSKSIIIIVLAFILIFVLTVGISFYFFNKKNNEKPYVWQGRYIWIDEGELTEVIDSKDISDGIKNRENADTWVSFRKNFTIDENEEIKDVLAKIVVDSKYWLYINDELVIRDGAVKRGEKPLSTYYDEVDITEYLKHGENNISILVWYFGRTGFSHIDSTHGALLFEAKIGDEYVVTDSSWKAIKNPAFLKDDVVNNTRLSESGIYYDANSEIANWYKTSFDDSSWENARDYGMAGNYPWGELIKRDIPQYKFGEITEYVNFDEYRNVTLEEDTLIELKLPKNIQFMPYLKVEAESGKEIIMAFDANYDEIGKAYKVRYITKGGLQEFESYGWLNSEKMFYYIPKDVKIISLGYRPTGYNSEVVGYFKSDDEFLNTLWTMAKDTLYVAMRDTYMDCPDRERAVWWGDNSLSMEQSMYVFDENANDLYEKSVKMLTGWKQGNIFLTVIPSKKVEMHLPVQMLLGVTSMYDYYLYTGDIEFLEYVYPHVKNYLGCWSIADNGLIHLDNFSYLWSWGDSAYNSDYTAVENMWYYYALESTYKMADALELEEEKKEIKTKLDSLNKSLNEVLWTGKGYKAHADDVYDGRANAVAVLSGLASEDKHEVLSDLLINYYDNSTFMEAYILEALMKLEETEEVQKRIKTRYQIMVDNIGYSSTLWEYWEKGYGSRNHPWSGGPLLIMSKYFAGIMPNKPGYDEVLVKPMLGYLKEIEAKTDSVKGEILVNIKKEENSITLNINVPEKTVIVVEKMTENPYITVNDKIIYKDGKKKNKFSIKVKDEDEKYIYIEVPDGIYNIVSK